MDEKTRLLGHMRSGAMEMPKACCLLGGRMQVEHKGQRIAARIAEQVSLEEWVRAPTRARQKRTTDPPNHGHRGKETGLGVTDPKKDQLTGSEHT